MEFKDLDELKDYIKKKALRKTKFILNLSKHKLIDTSKETLNTIYKVSLYEVRKEILKELEDGTITIKSGEDFTKQRKL